nr:MAG TPA: hypothetical protein [Caudoviricetes sp.]
MLAGTFFYLITRGETSRVSARGCATSAGVDCARGVARHVKKSLGESDIFHAKGRNSLRNIPKSDLI